MHPHHGPLVEEEQSVPTRCLVNLFPTIRIRVSYELKMEECDDDVDQGQLRAPFNKEYLVYSCCSIKSCAHLDNIIIRLKQFVPMSYRYEFSCCLLYSEPRFYTLLSRQFSTGCKYPHCVMSKVSEVKVIEPDCYNPA